MTQDVTWAGPVERAVKFLRLASEAAEARKFDDALLYTAEAREALASAMAFMRKDREMAT